MTDASTGEGRPFNGRLLALLKDWSHTGIVVVTVVVSGIRWSSSVDSRLTSIEDKLAGQQTVMQQAVGETTHHAGMAAQAAERAEAAVVRAEAAVTQNQGAQKKVLAGNTENRKAIADLKTEMKRSLDSFEWRIRMLEEQSRKAQEKK